MKVMFDLCAFSDLVERRAFDDSSASARKGTAYASFTFLEELASLRKKEEQMFTAILDQYASLTSGRIMLPWNELIRREIETGKPVIAEGALLPSEDHQEAIDLLREGSFAVDAIGEEVAEKKALRSWHE